MATPQSRFAVGAPVRNWRTGIGNSRSSNDLPPCEGHRSGRSHASTPVRRVIQARIGVTIHASVGARDMMTAASRRETEGVEVVSDDALEVTFINVGQGACTLIRRAGWTALVDGGTPGKMEAYLDFFRAMGRIDLIVGTHYDKDHLGGLSTLIEAGVLTDIGHVLLPPHVNPSGTPLRVSGGLPGFERTSVLLPEQFAAGHQVHDVFQKLEERVQGLVAQRGPETLGVGDSDLRRVEEMARSVTPVAGGSDEDGAGLALAARIALENDLPAISNVLGVGAVLRSGSMGRAAAGGGRRGVSRHSAYAAGAAFIAREMISATSLKRLVEALEAAGKIRWSADAAPDRATPYAGSSLSTAGLELWHLGPTHRYAHRHVTAIQKVWDDALRLVLTVDNRRPTLSNRLSHIVALRDREDPRQGILITGDSGFDILTGPKADSLADGWEAAVRGNGIIELPHHGGNWGTFGSRIGRALDGSSGQLLLYAGVGPDQAQPPSAEMAALAIKLRDVGGRAPLEILLANRPLTSVLRDLAAVLPPAPAGPPMVRLTWDGAWRAQALDTKEQPSTQAPVHGVVTAS